MRGTLSCIAKGTIEALEAFWDLTAHQTYALYELLMTITVSLVIALLAGLPDTHTTPSSSPRRRETRESNSASRNDREALTPAFWEKKDEA